MGAPIGNLNAAKERRWFDTLDRAIKQDEGKRLRAAAEKLLDLAADGQPWAVRELADRLDGKPAQGVILAGDPENPIQTVSRIERVVVESPKATDT